MSTMCREKVLTRVSSKDLSEKHREAIRSTNDGFEDESDLVRDALYALQGLPSAVRKLDRLARSYNATSADKSSQNLTTLWARSVTATALGKLLSVLARAGHLRCQLDAFVSFFLDGRPDTMNRSEDNPRRESKTKKKKEKEKDKNGPSDTKKEETAGQQSVGAANAVNSVSNQHLLSSRCLVNQGFGAAVGTVLRGHSAALNTLAASVAFRRLHNTSTHDFKAEYLRDQDPGPVIGYGCRDITLLEFYLHTREIRVQLQALAYICLRRDGRKFVGRVVGGDMLDEWSEGKPNGKYQEVGNWNYLQSNSTSRNHGNINFEDFPRGADLLTYLYEQLMEVDPIHQDLLRFLFERAYQPYSVFIRSWLYQAAVKDPFREFVIEQGDFNSGSSSINARRRRNFDVLPTDLKLRKGVSVPQFLESVRTPLIRAGQQLQVLMKLAETCELAQRMGQNKNTLELFERPDISSDTLAGHRKNSANVPALVYSKRQLQETVIQREKNMKVLNEQFDCLFIELSGRRHHEQNAASPGRSEKPPVSSIATEVNKKELPTAIGSEFQLEAASPSAYNFPGSEEYITGEMNGSAGPVKKMTEISVGEKKEPTTAENDPNASSPDLVLTENTESPFSTSKRAAPPEDKSSLYSTKEKHEFKRVNASQGRSDSSLLEDYKVSDKVEIYEPCQVHIFQFSEPAKGYNILPSPKFPMVQGQSLIADHQRGASWPVWGLPTNPFLMPATVDDFTPHFYAYTSFAGTFHPWDVTKRLSRASLNSLQTSALEESAGKHADISVEPPWFTSLASVFKDQLFEALNVHLQQPAWENADHGCGMDYGPPDASVQLGNGWKSQLHVGLDSRLTDPCRFSPTLHSNSDASGDLMSPSNTLSHLKPDMTKGTETEFEYSAVLDSKANSVQETNSTDKGLIKLQQLSELRQESLDGEFLVEAEFSKTPRESTIWTEEVAPSEDESGLVSLAKEISALRRSVEDRQLQELATEEVKEVNVYEAFNWEQYLKSSKSPFENPVREWSDGGVEEDDEEMPLSVVVNKCIVQEILSQLNIPISSFDHAKRLTSVMNQRLLPLVMIGDVTQKTVELVSVLRRNGLPSYAGVQQYECVSTLTVRLFQEGLCLLDHCHALRRYFFMEQGDWADYFIAALCVNRWGPSGSQLRQMEVQGMLEAALQRSSCEGDEYAERLHVCFPSHDSTSGASAQGSTKSSIAPFVDCSRLDAFDFISLEYRVDWPLTLVLTSQSLRLYNVLFTFLIRIKLAVYALGDIWRRLQGFDKSLHKLSRSPQFQQQRNRFRTLQQLRQQIFHLVTTVQRYVESKLLFVVWSKFLQDIQLEVKDMQELGSMHFTYLEGAMNECFLSPDTQGVKGCLDTIMQCVLDFLTHLRGASKSTSDEELIDDHLFAQVCQVNKVFQSSLQLLNIFHLKQEPQYRTNLSDLWMILDFNGFVTNAFFSDQ